MMLTEYGAGTVAGIHRVSHTHFPANEGNKGSGLMYGYVAGTSLIYKIVFCLITHKNAFEISDRR